jgi:hypothetical protein
VPRVDPIQTRARRHKQKEEQLIELLGEPVKDDKFKLRWVASGLMYFHNVPKREHEDGYFCTPNKGATSVCHYLE